MNDVMCPDCGCYDTTESIQDDIVCLINPYQKIIVRVPVITCTGCGFQYTDHRAEELRDRAVKNRKLYWHDDHAL